MSGKRFIIKIGTNLVSNERGLLNASFMKAVSEDIADIRAKGNEVVLVSSGAIGAGAGRLKMKSRPANLADKQAAAAVGQVILMEAYEKYFETPEQVAEYVEATVGQDEFGCVRTPEPPLLPILISV